MPSPAELPPEKSVRNNSNGDMLYPLLAVVSSLLVLFGFIQLCAYFYSIVVLFGVCLVATYILLGPIGLMERMMRWVSARSEKFAGFSRISRQWKKNLPDLNARLFSIVVVYVSFILLVTAGALFLVPALGRQVQEFGQAVPSYLSRVEDVLFDTSRHFLGPGTLKQMFRTEIEHARQEGKLPRDAQPQHSLTKDEQHVIMQSLIRKTLRPATQYLSNAMGSIFNNVSGVVAGTVSGVIFFLIGLLLTFYFLRDGEKIQRGFVRILPEPAQSTIRFFLQSTHEVMLAFIKGQVLLGALTGFYMFIIYSIFEVQYAIFLGSFLAVAEILPVVGTWIGLTPGFMVILFSNDPLDALWVFLCSYSYQTVKDNILAPKIVGDVMGLHPVTVILSLIIFAKLAGIVGVLLALPIVSIINVIIRYLLHGTRSLGKDVNRSLEQAAERG